MTNFVRWPKWAARLLLAAGLLLVTVAALPRQAPHLVHLGPLNYDDRYFQRAVVDRVARGEDYYTAAAAEQRANFYPTTPPQVFREPYLTWFLAMLQIQVVRRAALLILLAVATIAMRKALDRTSIPPVLRLPVALAQLTGFAIAWHGLQVYQHEVWAALLMALSLAVYRPDRYGLSVLLALAACLIRELSLPFIWAMLAFSLCERRWRESGAWILAMAIFLGLYGWHLHLASVLYRPGDQTSAGWLFVGGWNFVVETAKKNEILFYCPNWLVAAAVYLGLIGLCGWRDAWVSRAALIVGGYMFAFLFIGRPDNAYWGCLYSPLLPLGWLLAPVALFDLLSRAALGTMTRYSRAV